VQLSRCTRWHKKKKKKTFLLNNRGWPLKAFTKGPARTPRLSACPGVH